MHLPHNESTFDRSLRIILGTLMIIFGLLMSVWWLAGVGVAIFITGVVGFCGIYTLFGYSTCPMPKTKSIKKSTRSRSKKKR